MRYWLPLFVLLLPYGSPVLINEKTIIFAGVKFKQPISGSLQAMKMTTPTPIQQAAIAPLTSGLSAILHAETGSGKTLAYLLPLLKRICGDGEGNDMTPMQALIIVPTKELAVQVAADIISLTSVSSYSLVHLCISSRPRDGGFDKVTAPIIIGTPFKLLDALRSSSENTLEALQVRYCVVDEVDRALNVVSKYASNDQVRSVRDGQENPTNLLLSALIQTQPEGGMQVVAASATVGRPLRRELFRILQGGEGYGEMEIIRPSSSRTERDGAQAGSTRQVGIPKEIEHIAIMCEGDDSSEINTKLAVAKQLWLKDTTSRRACLFVPTAEDVTKVLGILKFWGIKEAKNLQALLGIVTEDEGKGSTRWERDRGSDVSRKTFNMDDEYNGIERPLSRKEKRLLEFGAATGVPAANRPRVENSDNSDESMLPKKERMTSEEMISKALQNRIGSSANLEITEQPAIEDRELFVVPVSGTRGLHLKDVGVIYILSPPKTMDEYLHMAGRTGREGKSGRVFTMSTLEELKRLQSWQTALDITYEVRYL